jgi:hypothetical protein
MLGYVTGHFSCIGYRGLSGRMAVNSELERMCKEVSMVFIKLLSHHVPGGSEETKKMPDNYTQFLEQIQTKNLPNMQQDS